MSLNNKAHQMLSRRVLLPVSRFQRVLRPSRRNALLSSREGMAFRRRSAGWSEEEKQKWVLDRLRFSVRRAARETQYWDRIFREIGFEPEADFSFEDYARLPVLERNDVRAASEEMISRAVPSRLTRRDSTGGSTGEPTHILLGPEEIGWRESGLEYPLARIGVPTGTATGFLWGHHLDPVARDTWRERFHDFESNWRWFDCFRLSPEVFDRYHRELSAWQPACVIAYASSLSQFAEYLAERGERPNYPTRCFVTGAEKLWSRHREIIERVFKRPVHERYGSRDAGLMAFQYHPRETLDYEVDWSGVLIEPETENDEASIIVTKLHADAMPMFRYRVGDVAHFPRGSRPGHPVFTLHEVIGREAAQIWLPGGKWIHGNQLPHMLKDYPVREFMFVQKADYSVELQLVPQNGLDEVSQNKIRQTIASNLPGVELRLVLVDAIPRTKANKWRPVVSEVQRETTAK